MSPLELVAAAAALLTGLALLAFWIWMMVDCLRHEEVAGHDRLIWALVILLAKLLGAAIYYFARYRPRRAARVAAP